MIYDRLSQRQEEIVLLDVRERVAKGVRLLDDFVPDWRERVDGDNLLILDEYYCILGQVFGGYFEGKALLDIRMEKGADYGFDTYLAPISDEDIYLVPSDVIEEEWLRHL